MTPTLFILDTLQFVTIFVLGFLLGRAYQLLKEIELRRNEEIELRRNDILPHHK